jgi:DNA mismatch repair ATPase MutL
MKSKLLLWLIALLPLVTYGQSNKVTIATVDHTALSKAVGYQVLQEFERGENYRRTLKDLKVKLEDAQQRLISASKSEELKKVQVEISFLTEKMSALSSLSTLRQRGNTGREELDALIKKNFSKDYAIVVMTSSGYSSNPLATAVYANVEYVDITEPVAVLVKKEMGEK